MSLRSKYRDEDQDLGCMGGEVWKSNGYILNFSFLFWRLWFYKV